jgi:hypothetical protein
MLKPNEYTLIRFLTVTLDKTNTQDFSSTLLECANPMTVLDEGLGTGPPN